MSQVETKVDKLDVKFDAFAGRMEKFIEGLDEHNDRRYAPRWAATVLTAIGMTLVLAFITALIILVFKPGLSPSPNHDSSTTTSTTTTGPGNSAVPGAGANANATATSTPDKPQSSQSVSVPLPSVPALP